MQLTFPNKELLIRRAYQEPVSDAALLLANHRSLANWNLIPLSKITVVLGPNSSGKSSIQEAFEILPMFSRGENYCADKLRLIEDATREKSLTPSYGLSARYPSDMENAWEYLSSIEERLGKVIKTPEGKVSLLEEFAARGEFPVFGRFYKDNEFRSHLADTVYSVVFEDVSVRTLKVSVYFDGELAGTWVANDGHQEICIKNFAKRFLMDEYGALSNVFDQSEDFRYNFNYTDWSEYVPENGPAWPSFGEPANFLFQVLPNEPSDLTIADEAFGLITAVFHYPLVSLIRRFFWTHGSDPVRDLDSDWFFCSLRDKVPGRWDAARSFRGNSRGRDTSGKKVLARSAIMNFLARSKDINDLTNTVLDDINRWINGKAFLDSGYQVRVGVKVCLPMDLDRTEDLSKFSLDQFIQVKGYGKLVGESGHTPVAVHLDVDPKVEFLARIFLVDQTGRELNFSEVGTGFSQILPILTYLGTAGNYVIRQPEVHLHPRLQSRVADCIVDSVSSDRDDQFSGNIFLETHSEHMVLRFLRRIRESHLDPLLHTSLTLYPNELSLVYVMPHSDRSEVFLIRVDSSGGFIDGWPEGFFDERDEDLWG